VAIAAQSCDRNPATSAHAPHHRGAGVGLRALDTELRRSGPNWVSRVEQMRLSGCDIRRFLEVSAVQGANKERWRELCEQAAVEQDPKKLLELTKQINELLEAKQGRLSRDTPPVTPNGSK
jgi:hypothetical protein